MPYKDVEKQNEWHRKFYQRNKKKRCKIASEYRKREKCKVKARMRTLNNIRTGKLVKSNICSNCEKVGRTDAHHLDYNKPDEIIELCHSCHIKLHKVKKERKICVL